MPDNDVADGDHAPVLSSGVEGLGGGGERDLARFTVSYPSRQLCVCVGRGGGGSLGAGAG